MPSAYYLRKKNNIFSSIITANRKHKRNKLPTIKKRKLIFNYYEKKLYPYMKKKKTKTEKIIKEIELFISKSEETRVTLRRKKYFDDKILLSILDNTSKSLTLKQVKDLYNQYTGINNYSLTTLRRYIRNKLKYKFISVKLFNKRIDSDQANNIEIVYIEKYMELLKNEHVILFLDETSVCENNNNKKFWYNRKKENIIYNSGRIKSVSITGVISSEGLLYYKLNDIKNNAESFYAFIRDFEGKLKENDVFKEKLKERKISIILDNARIHTAKSIRKRLKELSFNFVFQPPYSPFYNGIELLWGKLKIKKKRLIIRTE